MIVDWSNDFVAVVGSNRLKLREGDIRYNDLLMLLRFWASVPGRDCMLVNRRAFCCKKVLLCRSLQLDNINTCLIQFFYFREIDSSVKHLF